MRITPKKPPRGTDTISESGEIGLSYLYCQSEIYRYVHALMDNVVGSDHAALIAMKVCEWLGERRAVKKDFLKHVDDFHRGIQRKTLDELRNYQNGEAKFDREVNVDAVVPDDSIEWGARAPETPLDVCMQMEKKERVQLAVSQLSPQQQRVIRMYDLNDCPVEEVAAELGIKEGTVRQTRVQALKRLRELLTADPCSRKVV